MWPTRRCQNAATHLVFNWKHPRAEQLAARSGHWRVFRERDPLVERTNRLRGWWRNDDDVKRRRCAFNKCVAPARRKNGTSRRGYLCLRIATPWPLLIILWWSAATRIRFTPSRVARRSSESVSESTARPFHSVNLRQLGRLVISIDSLDRSMTTTTETEARRADLRLIFESFRRVCKFFSNDKSDLPSFSSVRSDVLVLVV